MRRVDRKRGERKLEVQRTDAVAQALADLDTRVEMIQALIPLGLKAVEEELQAAVAQLAGPRYQRGAEDRRYYRWGGERGSVYLADQKVAVRVPRVRDVHAEREVRLPVYERLQEPRGGDAQLMGRVLRGLGCRNYQETAALVPEVFGLSASTVSRRFIRASAAKLQVLMERDLSGHDLVALFLDGKNSVLIESLGEFEKWFATAATAPASKTSFWRKLFGTKPTRGPLEARGVEKLLERVRAQRAELDSQLHATDHADIQETTEQANRQDAKADARVGATSPVAAAELGASVTSTIEKRQQSTEHTKRSKIDFLHRHLIDYQRLFREIAQVSDGDAFLFLDDLYHIKRADQADVIDYFHRIAKNTSLWLKIGTIRHRTEWYRHSDPPTGVKLGDDADDIDLDLTLEKYRLTKGFLINVLRQIGDTVQFTNLSELLAPTAVDRLVLASGGVARDFLALFRRSIFIARERGGGARGPRVVAQDINQAAGEHDESKRDELKRDTLEEREQVEQAFDRVRSFCLVRVPKTLAPLFPENMAP